MKDGLNLNQLFDLVLNRRNAGADIRDAESPRSFSDLICLRLWATVTLN